MSIDRTELRKGLRETRKFVLAHHLPEEYYRCYSPVVLGRRVHLCARCAGVYPGILVGLLAASVLPAGGETIALVALLPLPALLDWSLTTFRDSRGTNVGRTLTGALLGCGYGLGLSLLVFDFEAAVLGIGLGYAIVAGALLYYSW